jgi:hypothetical protein
MKRRRQRDQFAALAFVAAVLPLIGCPPTSPPTQVCSAGQSVTIPASDATDPTLTYQVQSRGGVVHVSSGVSSPREIQLPPGGVTISAEASDPEGVRKITLALVPITCTTLRATGATTCTRGAAQIDKNEDAGIAGASGCTKRTLTMSTAVSRTLTTSRDQVEERVEVLATAQNFGGRNTTIQFKELVPRP